MTALRASEVSVAYDAVTVVDRVSLDVPHSAWMALIGPNGAGKSTFLRACAGLVDHLGEVLVDGVPAHSLGRRLLAQKIAFVPQRPHLPESLSVVDYVLMGRTPYIPYLGSESRKDLDVVREVISTLEMTHLAGRRLGSLSGGEAQRAVLARALAQEAPLLLLDEPTAALDIGHQQQVLELIDVLRVQHGLTVLCAMHDLTQASQFADSLLLLDRGHAVASGPPADVLTEGAIREHFGASVRVVSDESGAVMVIPIRSRHEEKLDEAQLSE
jgi:iron complex transport system ATP-binding protein